MFSQHQSVRQSTTDCTDSTNSATILVQLQDRLNKMSIQDSTDKLKDLVELCRAAKTQFEIEIIDLYYRSECKRPEGFIVYAIRTRQFNAIAKLLATSAPLCEYVRDKRFYNGDNALHIACKLNEPECICPLLEADCSFSAQNCQRNTPLHIAFQLGHMQCVQAFVKFFREHHAKANQGIRSLFNLYYQSACTVFQMAIKNGCIELVRIFLESAAVQSNVKICKTVELHWGYSAAQLAALNGDYEMIKVLLHYDSEACDYKNYAQYDAFDIEPQLKKKLSMKTRNGGA